MPDIHYQLLLILRDQKLLLEANWNFTHDALQEMGAQFHKAMFRNKSMWVKRMTFLKVDMKWKLLILDMKVQEKLERKPLTFS